jgi:hypothetical protein
MVVWEVPENEIDSFGQALASLSYVSHCYFRPPLEGWPFNLYTMIHAKNKDELNLMITEMIARCQPIKWRILQSVKELKKTSLNYFHDSR